MQRIKIIFFEKVAAHFLKHVIKNEAPGRSATTALGALGISKSIRNSRINVAKSELEMIAAATLQMVWETGKGPNGS